MRRRDLPDGDHELPCGVTLRISNGTSITAFFGPGAPTPSRATVTREASAITGLPLWLENWPDDEVLSHGVEWPGIGYAAIVLDHGEQVRECRDLCELGAVLGEIAELCLHADVGWAALRVDPWRLPTFGGDRPDVPGSFFWRWDARDAGAPELWPAQVLSWDADQMLLAADPGARPFCVPRHPASLFAGPLARRAGLAPCADAEAFEKLATVLPWDGSYGLLSATLIALSAHDRSGSPYRCDDARDLVVVVRDVRPWRVVVAVSRTNALRDPDLVGSLRRVGGEAPGTEPGPRGG
jgi:hypothetical protein